MRIDQFEKMLYDLFQMDACFPSTCRKYRKEFKTTSYEQWGITELIGYISERFAMRNYADLGDYISWTDDFIQKMTQYAKLGSKNAFIFQCARKMAKEVKDVLIAMK